MGYLRTAFWVLALAVIALFAFFVALGAFAPGEVLGVTAAVVALAALWTAHAIREGRHASARDPVTIRHRERRGF